jgi:DNA-binding FadR family transcriptional regulator
MSRNPVEIQPLETEQAVTFLKEVLKAHRSEPSDPDEYPFREEALRKMAEATQNKTAAELFRSCRRVLEKAVLANRLKPGGWIEVTDADELL